MHQVFEGSR